MVASSLEGGFYDGPSGWWRARMEEDFMMVRF